MSQPEENRRKGQNRPNGEMSLAKGRKSKSAVQKLFTNPGSHCKAAKNQRLEARSRKNLCREFLDTICCWIGQSADAAEIKPMSDADQCRSDDSSDKDLRYRLRLYSQGTAAESTSKRPPRYDRSYDPLSRHRR